MEGKSNHWVFILMMLVGVAAMTAAGFVDTAVPLGSFGSAFFAVGLYKTVSLWRIKNDPAHLKKLENMNTDDRQTFFADKAKGATLLVTIMGLSVIGVIFQKLGNNYLGNRCLLLVCFMVAVYLLIYRFMSRRH